VTRRPISKNRTPTSSASLEVLTPSAFPCSGQRHKSVGIALPTACAFRFSQPLGAFIRPEPTRPCSMPDPLLGSPSRAFLLPRSRTLFPAPFPSWRLRRLQGFAPRESPPPSPVVYAETRARSSPGSFPLQGFSLCVGPAFTGPPLLWFSGSDASGQTSSTSGSPTPRAWLVSLETANPPGVSGLLAVMSV